MSHTWSGTGIVVSYEITVLWIALYTDVLEKETISNY